MIEYFRYAARSISGNKLRSILTIISIAIGVANIVAMLSISEGLKSKTLDLLGRLGSEKILIWIGTATYFHPEEFELFSDEDIIKLKKIEGVKEIHAMLYKYYIINYKGKKSGSWITGLSRDAMTSLSKYYKLKIGRYFLEGKREAVIGYRIYTRFDLKIGDTLKIGRHEFKIVGILEEIGTYDDDISIFIPLSYAKEIFNEKGYNFLIIISDINLVEKVADRVRYMLMNERKKEDFVIYTQENLRKEVLKILNTIILILLTLSIVSIIVAGIITTNTMLTNIIERTREIGILKAIGAGTLNIVMIFLSELLIIATISSLIGIFTGYVISYFMPELMYKTFKMKIAPIFNLELIFAGIFISIFISIIFSIYPIYKALKIKAIDVLRYE